MLDGWCTKRVYSRMYNEEIWRTYCHIMTKKTSKCCAYLSNVAANIYFPLGENFTNETGGLLSSKNTFQNKFPASFCVTNPQISFCIVKKISQTY